MKINVKKSPWTFYMKLENKKIARQKINQVSHHAKSLFFIFRICTNLR